MKRKLSIHDYLIKTVSYDEDLIKEEEQQSSGTGIYNILGCYTQKGSLLGIVCIQTTFVITSSNKVFCGGW